MTASVIARLVSGGQAGADRAALDVAIAHGLPHGGWCPAGGWAEDLPAPPGLLALYPGLRATESAEPAERTLRNVRDSDATLVVRRGTIASPGTDLTTCIATRLERPWLETTDADEAATWLDALGTGLTLNVAGPRASEDPAAYGVAQALLEALLNRLDANTRIR